jgi:hypothetical protein
MAPNLTDSQQVQIRNMTLSNCPPAEIANVVGYSKRSVFAIQSYETHVKCGVLLEISMNRPCVRFYSVRAELPLSRSNPHPISM